MRHVLEHALDDVSDEIARADMPGPRLKSERNESLSLRKLAIKTEEACGYTSGAAVKSAILRPETQSGSS